MPSAEEYEHHIVVDDDAMNKLYSGYVTLHIFPLICILLDVHLVYNIARKEIIKLIVNEEINFIYNIK